MSKKSSRKNTDVVAELEDNRRLYSNKIRILQGRLETIEESIADIESIVELDSSLDDLCNLRVDFEAAVSFFLKNDEDISAIKEIIKKFDKLYSKTKCEIISAINSHDNHLQSINFKIPISVKDKLKGLNVNENHPNDNQIMKVKLPEIKIPSFDGTPTHWITFRDTFNAIVHSDPNIEDIVKFTILLDKLKGTARAAIGTITLSSAGYTAAWAELLSRFNNERLIVEFHIDKLFNLPFVARDNYTELRRLVDEVIASISSLKACNQEINGLGELYSIYIVLKKLDVSLRKEWEGQQDGNTLPKWECFLVFLQKKCRVLESVEVCKKPLLLPTNSQLSSKINTNKSVMGLNKTQRRQLSDNSNFVSSGFLKPNSSAKNLNSYQKNKHCVLCKGNHISITSCPQFLKEDTTTRYEKVKQLGICINCFKSGHTSRSCYADGCGFCSSKHHTLLHHNKTEKESNIASSIKIDDPLPTSSSVELPSSSATYYLQNRSHNHIILSTAVILIEDKFGIHHKCRVLLDSASHSNFITKSFTDRFDFNKQSVLNLTISSLNSNQTPVSEKISTKIKSIYGNFETNIDLLIVPTIANNLPPQSFEVSNWSIPNNINLADPCFNTSSPIDALLGAEIFYNILSSNKLQLKNNFPVFQESALGWIIGGKFVEREVYNFATLAEIDPITEINKNLKLMWELDNIPTKSHLSEEQQYCENHFSETHYRDQNGRYTVFLPIKQHSNTLGESIMLATKRFHSIEKRFDADIDFKSHYVSFMDEYLKLGHMKEVPNNIKENKLSFYLPHHAVLKPSSSTTKCRVVFDASAKTSNKLSLNDILLVGPTIQQELFDIVLRFRKYVFVLTADISKMYRQINVDASQTSLQRILWRDCPSKTLKKYELTTVTYGTASAPYLATRVLFQLADDEEKRFPVASKIAKSDFYIDDLLTGANTIEEAKIIKSEMMNMLECGGFKLHKWTSNCIEILENMPDDIKENLHNQYIADKAIKALGLFWFPNRDLFAFIPQPFSINEPLTKRSVISNISKLFDPLGLLAPTIVIAKLIIQSLWKANIDWDTAIPDEVAKKWTTFRSNLDSINNITLKRCVINSPIAKLEIHGFADASQQAYGACIYLKSVDEHNNIELNLLCSKSRVAPLKCVTLPRLELCAALLLSRLVNKTIDALMLPKIEKIILYSDSTITLAWIKTESYLLKTFVANRVSEIQELTSKFSWTHVKSADNPADLISRGVMPHELQGFALWWQGPQFLYNIPETTLVPVIHHIGDFNPEDSELKPVNVALHTGLPIESKFKIENYSNLSKMLRIVAYICRFWNIYIYKTKYTSIDLSLDEVASALLKLIKLVQGQEFAQELLHLKNKKQLNSNSKLLTLSPFLDSDNVIRVGGRLSNSNLEENVKHQILLPASHHFTKLIFKAEHERNLHVGPQTLLSFVRQKYWPLNGKNCARQIVRNCITCFRAKPEVQRQLMGNLPLERITPSRPFTTTGVDLCGPFMIKNKRQRNSSAYKCYAALFVCFVSKAVHIEIISDCTSSAFLACLKRFVSRRGRPNTIWSDNATNFVGCKNDLKELYDQFIDQIKFQPIKQYCIAEQINWKFIPPRSPNFGGLWESSIKSLKTHLKKITINQTMSYEELNTLLIQIEGIMNSRPLTHMSTDPSDPEPLTPGHFLVGSPITAIVEPSYNNIVPHTLDVWKRVSQMSQHFWKRFSTEYLHTLQQRYRWKQEAPNLKIDDVVLVMDDNLYSTQWLIGRIMEVIPGTDGKVRVVQVKTKHGIFRRAISKICKLPIN